MSDIARPYEARFDERPHPIHSLVSWPAVIAGAIVAAAVGAMLNLLGLALGAAAINPFDLSRADAAGFSVGAGIWTAVANAIALFVGGFIAARAAKYADHHRGLLHGLAVWGLAFALGMTIAALGAGAGTRAGLNADSPGVNRTAVDRTTGLIAGAAGQGKDVVLDDGRVIPAEDVAAVAPGAQPAAQRAADAASAIALWAFLSMLAGAVTAVFGARYGARRHPWEARAHLIDGGPDRPMAREHEHARHGHDHHGHDHHDRDHDRERLHRELDRELDRDRNRDPLNARTPFPNEDPAVDGRRGTIVGDGPVL